VVGPSTWSPRVSRFSVRRFILLGMFDYKVNTQLSPATEPTDRFLRGYFMERLANPLSPDEPLVRRVSSWFRPHLAVRGC